VHRISVSTKVYLAFLGVFLSFVAVLAFSLLQFERLKTETLLIHHCLVPLSLTLSEAHSELNSYDAVLEEREQEVLRRVAQFRSIMHPSLLRGAAKFARAQEFISNCDSFQPGEADATFLADAADSIRVHAATIDDFEQSGEHLRQLIESDDAAALRIEQHERLTRLGELRRAAHSLTRRARAQISDSTTRMRALERETMVAMVTLSVAAMLLSAGILLLVHLTLRPLVRLREAVRSVGLGRYSERLAMAKRADEIGELVVEFNRMSEQIEEREHALREQHEALQQAYDELLALRTIQERTQAELIKKERLAAVGRMTSQVTHELRNPLSSLGLNMELLEESLDSGGMLEDASVKASLAAISAEIERMTSITEEYLSYARLPVSKPVPMDINTSLRALLSFMQEEIARHEVALELSLCTNLPPLIGDEQQLRRAFLNLFRNALEAMKGGGCLRVLSRADSEAVVIEVGDSGVGISANDLEHIFEPFYSTKSTGTGLGLALTAQIIEEHGGQILVASRVGEGTLFRITLPAQSGTASAGTA
jgi:signal transduction histidine kinase